MLIDKEARGLANRSNLIYLTSSFRDGFKQVLEMKSSNARVLIPSYVGLSLEEGSGILDPIKEAFAEFEFYGVNENLDPIVDSLRSKIEVFNPTHVLVVNYFGFLISNRYEVFKALSSYDIITIEDFAHLMIPLQYRMGVKKYANYEIFSLHKTLGSQFGGGAVLCNSGSTSPIDETISARDLDAYAHSDLEYISKERLNNYLTIDSKIKTLQKNRFQPFFTDDRTPIIPLNYPIRMSSKESRHSLFMHLDKEGIVPTALYHRLVPEISNREFPYSVKISECILNLPVHQDITSFGLEKMFSIVEKFNYSE